MGVRLNPAGELRNIPSFLIKWDSQLFACRDTASDGKSLPPYFNAISRDRNAATSEVELRK